MRQLALPCLALALALTITRPAPACPLCKEALANDAASEHSDLGDGLSRSILLMLGVPILLIGSGTIAIVRAASRGSLPEL